MLALGGTLNSAQLAFYPILTCIEKATWKTCGFAAKIKTEELRSREGSLQGTSHLSHCVPWVRKAVQGFEEEEFNHALEVKEGSSHFLIHV